MREPRRSVKAQQRHRWGRTSHVKLEVRVGEIDSCESASDRLFKRRRLWTERCVWADCASVCLRYRSLRIELCAMPAEILLKRSGLDRLHGVPNCYRRHELWFDLMCSVRAGKVCAIRRKFGLPQLPIQYCLSPHAPRVGL